MGLSHSPSIVTDGLDFYVDPNNTRCYPGFGNTVYNIVNSSIGATLVNSSVSPIDSTNIKTFYLSGSNYVVGPNDIALTNNFTISIWFKLRSYSDSGVISKWYADVSNNHRCWFIGTDSTQNAVVVVLSSNGTYENSTIKRYVVPVSLNQYTQITITFSTNNLLVYKNGVLSSVTKILDASITNVFNTSARPIQIGYNFDGSNYYISGNVGEAQIYSRVLTPSEIFQNYHTNKKKYLIEENIVTNGLVLNLDPSNPNSYSGTGNTIYNLTGLGNTGTLTNGPTFSGLSAGSFTFDGSNDYINIPKAGLVYGTGPKTLMAWAKLTLYVDGVQVIASYGSGPNATFFISAYRLTGQSGGYNNDLFGGTITLNTWFHICNVYDGTTAFLYFNGALMTSGTKPWNVTSTTYDGKIGAQIEPQQYFNGNISQVQLYNRALSATEIQQNYNATKGRFVNALPAVRNGLVLELDAANTASYSGSGNTWYDLSGNGYNSTLVGSPVFSGIASTANFLFDANTKSATLNTNLLSNYSSGTIECSVYITNLASSFILARQRNGVNTFSVLSVGSYCDAGGQFLAGLAGTIYYHNKNAQTVLSSSTALLVNTWYRLSITFTTSSVILYINGIQNATVAGDYSVPNDASTDPRIGAWIKDGTNYPMNGRLAHFAIYNRALSAYEIKQNFDFYRTRYGI